MLDLFLYFALLSVIAVGGISSVLPEMQRFVVELKGWMSPDDFLQLFAIAQAAPGPNVLIVSLIGWKVFGMAGALVAFAAMAGPTAVLTWWVSGLWERFKEAPQRKAIQRALAPLTVGLVLASGFILATPNGLDWRNGMIAAASAAAMVTSRVNPLWLLAAGGVAGALLF
jgi:chromate transporter